MTEGHKLIDKMREENKLSFWNENHLERFINKKIHIHDDPINRQSKMELNGLYTLAELEACIIALAMNDGEMRSS